MKNILEIKKTNKGNIAKNANVIFNSASPFSEGIGYDAITGEIILPEIGQYSIRWWVSTETTLAGCIQFALKSSQGDVLLGCSPTKRGQVAGFANIVTKSKNVVLTLVNMGDYPVVLSQSAPVTSTLIAMRVPEDGVVPSFKVDSVTTLEPGESATADIHEDAGKPNNWLLSFGIPKGNKGDKGNAGDAPHIDADTGNWFVGATDTGVRAQGPAGSAGVIPFCCNKRYATVSADDKGEPMAVLFSGFGGLSYEESVTHLKEGEWASGKITIDKTTQYGTSFVMPHNATVKKIHLLVACEDYYDSEESGDIYPFACLAVCNTDKLVYTILKDTMVYTEPYLKGTEYPDYTVRKGVSAEFNKDIAEGALVAIIAGITTKNPAFSASLQLRLSGGIQLI